MNRGLSIAFGVNTFLTFMAFILLVVKPPLLGEAVGWHIDSSAHYYGYMLGAAEWGLAALTFFGRKLTDPQALRVICLAVIVFHVSSACVLMYTFFAGGSDFAPGLWTNVIVPRFGISALCAYFGLYKLSTTHKESDLSRAT
jgi:hypothetical protein